MSGEATRGWVRVAIWLYPAGFRQVHEPEMEAHLTDVAEFGTRGDRIGEAVRTAAVGIRRSLVAGARSLPMWATGLAALMAAAGLVALGQPISDLAGPVDFIRQGGLWVWGVEVSLVAGFVATIYAASKGRPLAAVGATVAGIAGVLMMAAVALVTDPDPAFRRAFGSPLEVSMSWFETRGLIQLAGVLVLAPAAAWLVRRRLLAPPPPTMIVGIAVVLSLATQTAGLWWLPLTLALTPLAPAALWAAPAVAPWAGSAAVWLAIPFAVFTVGRRYGGEIGVASIRSVAG